MYIICDYYHDIVIVSTIPFHIIRKEYDISIYSYTSECCTGYRMIDKECTGNYFQYAVHLS